MNRTDVYLSQYVKKCAECNKLFVIQCSELYTYKIEQIYYCCYSHWIKNRRDMEVDEIQKQEAYLEAMRLRKNKYNRRRRHESIQ